MTIETHYVSQDYYGASAIVGAKSRYVKPGESITGKYLFQFAKIRHEAFMGVLWQLYQEKGWKV